LICDDYERAADIWNRNNAVAIELGTSYPFPMGKSCLFVRARSLAKD